MDMSYQLSAISYQLAGTAALRAADRVMERCRFGATSHQMQFIARPVARSAGRASVFADS